MTTAASKVSTSRSAKKATNTVPAFPVEPRVIQVIKKPRFVMNHSYRDFSSVPPLQDEPANAFADAALDLKTLPFPLKVHHMLEQEEFHNYISWCDHGRAFRIAVPKKMEEHVLEKYMGHKRYSSFLRQLSNHGFKHISQGPDRNCYYHELMLRDMHHLVKYFPAPKDARRLVPDPDNELDFAELSQIYPLPGDSKKREAVVEESVPAPEAKRQKVNDYSINNNTNNGLGNMISVQQLLSAPLPTLHQAPVPQQQPSSAIDSQARLSEMINNNNQLIAVLMLKAQLEQQQQQQPQYQPVNNNVAPQNAAFFLNTFGNGGF